MAATKTALVVGGTGPTGPGIVNGLLRRGYRVTIFHRGTHESDEIPDCVEHIHGDPHFLETIAEVLFDREYDLVVTTYGRVRFLAEHLAGKAGRFIAVGSLAATVGHFASEALFPQGLAVPTSESAPTVAPPNAPDGKFAYRIAATERRVLELHPTGTILRYPFIYGPHQVLPLEWCLVRRALDKRPFLVLPDGGLRIITRGYSLNMAHAVLCAVDRSEAAAGGIFNCADERQLTLRQVADVIAGALGHDWEILSVPGDLAVHAWPMIYTDPKGSWHRHYSTEKIRRELGYEDVVSSVEGVARTALWYAARRKELGGAIEDRLGDPFDYAAEDTFRADWLRLRAEFERTLGKTFQRHDHPYAHPDEPGQSTDHKGR